MDTAKLKIYRDGRMKEIAEYCESDVINTCCVWQRYELFRGKLTPQRGEEVDQCGGEANPGAVAADRNVGRRNSRWRRKNHAASASSGARFLTVVFLLYAQPDPAENEHRGGE